MMRGGGSRPCVWVWAVGGARPVAISIVAITTTTLWTSSVGQSTNITVVESQIVVETIVASQIKGACVWGADFTVGTIHHLYKLSALKHEQEIRFGLQQMRVQCLGCFYGLSHATSKY